MRRQTKGTVAKDSAKLSTTFSRGSHCFARSLCGIDVHSLPRSKERTKKARQRLPPLETALPAVLKKERRKGKVSASLLHLGRISARPRWVRRGKTFCYPVLFELSPITGNEAKTIVVCKSGVRATPVFASFLNLQTQRLKMLTFASCCALARPQRRTAGIQRALGPLARFFVLFVA